MIIGAPKPKPPPKPKPFTLPSVPGVGPQNLGQVGYRPGDPGNPSGPLAPGLGGAPAPLQAPVAAPAAPPPDYQTLINADPGYIDATADRNRQNQLALEALRHGFAQSAQGSQDNANSHGALFSGAAVNAQRSIAQSYADQQAQQAANYAQGGHQDRTAAWQRILAQLAGGGS